MEKCQRGIVNAVVEVAVALSTDHAPGVWYCRMIRKPVNDNPRASRSGSQCQLDVSKSLGCTQPRRCPNGPFQVVAVSRRRCRLVHQRFAHQDRFHAATGQTHQIVVLANAAFADHQAIAGNRGTEIQRVLELGTFRKCVGCDC